MRVEATPPSRACAFVQPAVVGRRRHPAQATDQADLLSARAHPVHGRLHDCIAYGPGILDLAHQPDEWVGIDDMVDAAQVMTTALGRLLGTRD